MKKQYQAIIVLTVCSLFLFLKYIAQLFPSLISTTLVEQYQLSGVEIGVLASSYYYSYTTMQIVSGILLDKYDLRIPAFLAIFTIAIGLFGFAYTDSLWSMCLCRILMGIGCSFATTLYMKSATIWTSPKAFSFISSLLGTATMLGAAVGAAPIAVLFSHMGWQQGLISIAYIGLGLSFLAIIFVTNDKRNSVQKTASISNVKQVMFNRSNLWLLLYSGLTFSPVVILGGLWGVPFLGLKLDTTASNVAVLISVMFIGHAVGSPIWALLSTALQNKKKIMIAANAISFTTLCMILFSPLSYLQTEILFFIFGFCVGAFMLSFDLCRQMNSITVMGFAVAFINSGEGIVGSILEPGIGWILDLLKAPNATHFSLASYQCGLSILPICFIASTFVIYKLPFFDEKTITMRSIFKLKRQIG